MSRLAYSFNSGIGYFENATCHRVNELGEHIKVIADDVKNG